MIVAIICQRGSYFLPCGQRNTGAIAQLGERVLCKHEVVGSIPSGSTIHFVHGVARRHCDLFVLDPSDLRANGWAPPPFTAAPCKSERG